MPGLALRPLWVALTILVAVVVILVDAPSRAATANQRLTAPPHDPQPDTWRGLVLTDAQHAALVIHAGERPRIVHSANEFDPGTGDPGTVSSAASVIGGRIVFVRARCSESGCRWR